MDSRLLALSGRLMLCSLHSCCDPTQAILHGTYSLYKGQVVPVIAEVRQGRSQKQLLQITAVDMEH